MVIESSRLPPKMRTELTSLRLKLWGTPLTTATTYRVPGLYPTEIVLAAAWSPTMVRRLLVLSSVTDESSRRGSSGSGAVTGASASCFIGGRPLHRGPSRRGELRGLG